MAKGAEFTADQQRLANTIWEVGAFKVGAFRLKLHETNPQAPLSPYYISLREKDVRENTFPLLVDAIAAALFEDSRRVLPSPDYNVGIPKAGNPIAERISLLNGAPVRHLEKDEAGTARHITSRFIEHIEPGKVVLGLDDLITQGHTKYEFVEAIGANGLRLGHLAVALDREQGGMEELLSRGVKASASIKVRSQLLPYYYHTGRLDQSTFDQIVTYIDSQKTR